ncbi:MAG: GAF domain-containing protein, partial [Nitrospiraceae bacterium]|nr:GAF domain-containing protein [Nitrospiraceae bacterium]
MKLHSVDSKEKEIGRLRAQVAALEQLLAVHEQTVTAQAGRIEEGRQQIEAQSEALQAIMTGTASVTGHDFFSSLVTSLADALKVRYAFVGELHDSRIKQIHTLAVWSRDRLSDNFSYGLAGTPCANVVEGSLCSYQQEVRRQFPHDALLAEWEVESCCSVPLFDRSECVIGALVVMHDRRMQTAFDVQRMLTIFAARAGAELERKRAEQCLRQTSERSLKQESALLKLTQSEGLQTGDLASGLRCITETAAQTLGVSRVSIWRYSEAGKRSSALISTRSIEIVIAQAW